MWLTALLIVLLAINLFIGAYLKIKKISKEWRRKSALFNRSTMSVGNLVVHIILLPFDAIFLPWKILGEYTRTKMNNSHPYLADIIGHVFVENISLLAFYFLLINHFFPGNLKLQIFNIAASYIIIGTLIVVLTILSIINTRGDLREKLRENIKKPG